GFTALSTELEPKFLIDELNDIFTAFDNIVEENHCERIKTIGDAYLCVCGMPEENERHAENVVRSALQIINYLQERNQRTDMTWEIRIGIHTGRVVGGVVGVKKYIYDVFGDTINTCARMEANSEPMRINISETTYQLVKPLFDVSPRGSMPVKGKGDMNMYFVEREKSPAN
ncbi:MAG: adenylate/guanylate cyclase domain-containing protein, partial [Pseudomonadota bacterium]